MNRRQFLSNASKTLLLSATPGLLQAYGTESQRRLRTGPLEAAPSEFFPHKTPGYGNPQSGSDSSTQQAPGEMKPTVDSSPKNPNTTTLFLCGDVMTGRGIDQVLPNPGDPRIYEPYVSNALDYVKLAQAASGPIPKPVEFSYIWGDALEELERVAPDVRIINLETSVTESEDYWRGKGINYKMHPENIPCITLAKIDCCSLANNHVLDWGYAGLEETLQTLKKVNVQAVGAGSNSKVAAAPAVIELSGKGRVIVFSFGSLTSGIPAAWAAAEHKPGINLLQDFSEGTVRRIADKVQAVKRHGDLVVASIHWGGNWGYEVTHEQRRFAHLLIDQAGVDLVHGHSSHHAKGIEVYKDRPILYGCGDFLNDYEGISGYEAFRGDLVLMYFVSMEPLTGKLKRLEMTPMQTKGFQAIRAKKADVGWLRHILDREGQRLGTRVDLKEDNFLVLRWEPEAGRDERARGYFN